MRMFSGVGLAVIATLALPGVRAEDLKSGPEKKIGGSFTVKAISGENAGKSLCYV